MIQMLLHEDFNMMMKYDSDHNVLPPLVLFTVTVWKLL